jgi:hypothetical protein
MLRGRRRVVSYNTCYYLPKDHLVAFFLMEGQGQSKTLVSGGCELAYVTQSLDDYSQLFSHTDTRSENDQRP